MPNYKTHSIHSDKVFPYLDKRIDIDKEDLKTFSFGPDCLAFSDLKSFNNQHDMKSKYFFECLIKEIKICKYQDNKEMMAFLYGQLEHYILDSTFHPYIYYMIHSMPKEYAVDNHATFELWLDDYFMNKYNIKDKNYFSKFNIKDSKVRKTIDYVYKTIYKCYYASKKYDLGISFFTMIEKIRNGVNKTIPQVAKRLKITDISYGNGIKIIPYLNFNRENWIHPFNKEIHHESLNELWNKAVYLYIKTIEEVNAYLYDDKELKCSIIESNLSYDTGLDSNIKKRILIPKYPNKEV